jgi:hypothetical protein
MDKAKTMTRNFLLKIVGLQSFLISDVALVRFRCINDMVRLGRAVQLMVAPRELVLQRATFKWALITPDYVNIQRVRRYIWGG